MQIAKKLGTTEQARVNLLAIQQTFEEGRRAVAAKKLVGKPVLVHRFQESIAVELGLTPAGVFGPDAPEALAIAEASRKDVALILDNLHNPVGQPFREVLKDKPYRQLINFPGLKNTKTLTDVIRYNISQITSE
jgi:zinc transport system substrate-binding protein